MAQEQRTVGEARKTILLDSPDQVKPYVHQFMPALSPEAYESLKEDIRQNGILMPLLLDEDYAVVDGHNRMKIWHELIEEGFRVREVAAHVIPGLDKHTAHNLAIGVNIKRRHMTPPQKRELVAQELRYLARYYEEQGKSDYSWDNTRLADHLAVGRRLVKSVRENLEESGEIPYAAYFVRIIKPQGSNATAEQIQSREKLESWGRDYGVDTSLAKDRDVSDSPNGNDAVTLSDGTQVKSEAVEEIVGLYRTEAEMSKNLPEVASKVEVGQRSEGALEALRGLGIEVPEIPHGYTHEEQVYATVAEFRDRLLEMPSDPKAVARTTEDYPVVARNAVEDFGELARWMGAFYVELSGIAGESANQRAAWHQAVVDMAEELMEQNE